MAYSRTIMIISLIHMLGCSSENIADTAGDIINYDHCSEHYESLQECEELEIECDSNQGTYELSYPPTSVFNHASVDCCCIYE
mgnify:CR=1 FL=1